MKNIKLKKFCLHDQENEMKFVLQMKLKQNLRNLRLTMAILHLKLIKVVMIRYENTVVLRKLHCRAKANIF